MLYIHKRVDSLRRYNGINKNTPNNRVPRYMTQILTELKGEIHSSTIISGDFCTPLSIMQRTTRKKIDKGIKDLNRAVNQIYLTDTCSALHTTAEYIFFSMLMEHSSEQTTCYVTKQV